MKRTVIIHLLFVTLGFFTTLGEAAEYYSVMLGGEDAATFLLPFSQPKEGTKYFGKAFVAIQKVKGGYLIRPDARFFADTSTAGVGLLETSVQLNSQETVCGLFEIKGFKDFVGLDGFTHSLRRLKVVKRRVDPNIECYGRHLQ